MVTPRRAHWRGVTSQVRGTAGCAARSFAASCPGADGTRGAPDVTSATTGLPPNDMTGLTVTFYERALTTSVNDIEHIESRSIPNDGIIKIFFQPAVNINSALAEISAMSQTVLKQMPAADPELQRIHRADPAARHIKQATLRDDLVRSGDQLHPPGRLNRGCDCVGTRRQTFPSEDCRRSRGKKGGHGCQ
jgi:hypothetical protein